MKPALILLLASATAHAQPSAAQKETARGLMAEGRELRERGDLDGALTRFNAADSLMGVPTTGFEVAATQVLRGRLVEARETLRRVLAIPQSADDPEPFTEARSKARVLDQQLLGRIGALRFVVSGVSEAGALEISVDGETVPKAASTLPFRVNPGRHSVVARAHGRELKREVDIVEAQSLEVELEFATDTPPAATTATEREPVQAAAPQPPAAQKARRSGGGLPTLAYVGGGVALAGIVVGSAAGVSAISHKNDAERACIAGSCPPSSWGDLDSARAMASVSTWAFVFGAVGAAVGAGAILLDDDSSSNGRALLVSPDVSHQGAWLTIRGKF